MSEAIAETISKKASKQSRFLYSARSNPLVIIGAIIIFFLVIVSLTADLLPLNSPFSQSSDRLLIRPFTYPQFPLGTDELGRCILSRVIYGSRVSLSVGFITTILSAAIGIFIGLISGYLRGFIGDILGRLIDVALATPGILVALGLSSVLGSGLTIVMISISLVWWANYARVIRGQTLQLREMDFVTAARTIGVRSYRILWRHIFPNLMAQVFVMVSLNVANAILIEAGLSFLGIGSQPPIPSWGAMLSTGRNYMISAPWLTTIPGTAIIIAVLGFNLLGDGLRDVLDPRMRR